MTQRETQVTFLAGILGFSNYMEITAINDSLDGTYTKSLEKNEDYSSAYLRVQDWLKAKKQVEVNH